MTNIVPNSGELEFLNAAFTSGLNLRLFTNNITPSGTTTLASLNEANFNGYTSGGQALGSWTIVTVAGKAQATIASPTWFVMPPSATQTIYGYFIASGSALLALERFGTPIVIDIDTSREINVGTITITLTDTAS